MRLQPPEISDEEAELRSRGALRCVVRADGDVRDVRRVNQSTGRPAGPEVRFLAAELRPARLAAVQRCFGCGCGVRCLNGGVPSPTTPMMSGYVSDLDGGAGRCKASSPPSNRTRKTQSARVSTTLVTIPACLSGNDTPPNVPSSGLVEPPLDRLGRAAQLGGNRANRSARVFGGPHRRVQLGRSPGESPIGRSEPV